MTPERWQEIKGVLDQALDRTVPERKAFLDERCDGDEELRREVVSLLASEEEATDFIETPVFRIRTEELASMAEGQRIGAYRVVREVGRGGMGAVYLAQRDDREFDRRVALKLIRRGMDSDEILDRFRAERQILAHLDHENIGKLLDGGTTEDGRPYFVMEHVEGEPIDRYCDARRLSIPQRLALFRQVCAAVQFAHQNLVVHRDLKPGNILVTADGVPKLLDFGIAKLLNPEQEAFALTRLELRPMTPAYASPEQVRGEAISTASDVYSLGVLLYGLLTGRSPYRLAPGDPEALSRAIRDEVPAKPSSVVLKSEEVRKPDGSTAEIEAEAVAEERGVNARTLRRQLAGDLDNIVLKAMSKEVDRRYASAGQLADDLDRQLQGLPVTARKDTARYRTAKFVARHKLGVGLAATLFLVLVVFSVTVTVLLRAAVRERDRAEGERKRAEAVVQMLTQIFEKADPSKTRGETIPVREVLELGVDTIEKSLAGEPLLQADLRETMGSVFRSLGLYSPAEKLLRQALEVRKVHAASDPLRLARTLHNLAGVLRDQNLLEEAESLILEALKLQRQQGRLDLDYARGLNNLGEIADRKKQTAEAEKLYKESLRLKESLPDADERDRAVSLNNLGSLYLKRRNFQAAEPLLRQALQIRKKLSAGAADTDVGTSLNNVANLLLDTGRRDEALPYLVESLAMRRRIYGDGHIRVAKVLNNLCKFYDEREKPAVAEPYCREAVAIGDRELDRQMPERAVYLRNFASVLVARRKPGEAERLIREALAIFRGAESEPSRVADAEGVLGSCLAARGRFAEAEPLLLGALKVLEADEGGAQRAPEVRRRLVALYEAWGKPGKAAPYRAPAQAAAPSPS